MSRVALRIVYPHQLFEAHLEAGSGTRFVLVEEDLLFRQFPFHAHKLVLHRASMAAFAERLRGAGFEVEAIGSESGRTSASRLTELIREASPGRITVFDVVDDWVGRDLRRALEDAGAEPAEVLESPGFLTSRSELTAWFGEHPARMQHFYSWQRRRLDVLVDGDSPVGGRWSFDTENRKKLPKGHIPPTVSFPQAQAQAHVADAIASVGRDFPDAPGDPASFAWPTTHTEAVHHLDQFLAERFALFGPYEDALSAQHPYLYHSLITPMLNIGLLTPAQVLEAALDAAEGQDVPIESLEGFVRQVIGWREYMRATYHLYGRRLRTANRLAHTRSLGAGWWTGQTGLDPVDAVIGRVLDTGYAHHIERLMVLGNAMCLLRIDPDEVYEWFMALFIDAYDWVMVPNVYGMSQFAAGEAMTTKPYVSGSNYLRTMSDFAPGPWTDDWDALYWTFVHDHREVFEANFRSRRMPAMWDGFAEEKRAALRARAAEWLA